MDEVLDEDEEDDGEGNGPACKKPRLADEIGSELDTALRVVPQQTATSNQLVLVFYCKYMFVFERWFFSSSRPKAYNNRYLWLIIPNDISLRPSKAKAMAMVKAQDDGCKTVGGTRLVPTSGERATSFHGIDLVTLGIPREALPIKGYDYKGRKGYTVHSAGGAVPWTLFSGKGFPFLCLVNLFLIQLPQTLILMKVFEIWCPKPIQFSCLWNPWEVLQTLYKRWNPW